MKKLSGLFVLLVFASLPAMAQDETPKAEVSGGYTYVSFNAPASSRINMNGWNVGADFNLSRWLGVAANFDGVYATVGGTGIRDYTYMFGPRIYPVGHQRLAPFVEALFGVSHFSIPAAASTDNALGWEVGGGLDASITRNLAVRVGEIDFEQTRNFGGNPNQDNIKFSAGIVLRF